MNEPKTPQEILAAITRLSGAEQSLLADYSIDTAVKRQKLADIRGGIQALYAQRRKMQARIHGTGVWQ